MLGILSSTSSRIEAYAHAPLEHSGQNCQAAGSCSNPHNISVDLGSSSWVPTASTCNTTDSSPCLSSGDYTYRLPALNATRNITIDTCVAGVDAWDTVLFVFPEQDGACTSCPVSALMASCCRCSVAKLSSKGVLAQTPHRGYNIITTLTSSASALPSCCSYTMLGCRAMRCSTIKEVSVVKVCPVSPSLPVPGSTTWWWWRAMAYHLVGSRQSAYYDDVIMTTTITLIVIMQVSSTAHVKVRCPRPPLDPKMM
ncbi:hypothetical protein HaLaN_16814 [Haematococcus lacustris]|uniref:Uncharacterized protein n=1 Tax=Haematococcus lacustris TaxID=44745 RepID=A0A699ZMR3_HAELA|nr:hypothetical protein HaLaN_16814 [Haematococcus lacustris]